MEGKQGNMSRNRDDDFDEFSDEEPSAKNNAGSREFNPREFDVGDEDDDGDYDDMNDSYDASDNGREQKQGTVSIKKVDNDHYDEAMELDASVSGDSVDTNEAQTPKVRQVDSPPKNSNEMFDKDGGLSDSEDPGNSNGRKMMGDGAVVSEGKVASSSKEDPNDSNESAQNRRYTGKLLEMDSSSRKFATTDLKSPTGASDTGSESDDASSASTSRGGESIPIKDGYNPKAYAHLNVSDEVRELFQYIVRYKPHNIDLDSKLRPFIPDYIPAVGEIDAFIKVPRPDMQQDELGLKVLDEPGAEQSDPTVLDLQLRAISKKSNLEPMVVRSIENADKNPKLVANWIKSIKDLHRSKPPPQVNYTKNMPDIESLMQVWPEEVELLLKEVQLPSADLDLDLKDYARVVCAILDIPVFNSMTESLHVLFTLYSEFCNNQHFRNNLGVGGSAQAGTGPAGIPADDGDSSWRPGSRGDSRGFEGKL